jgi:hypothetical protein
MCREYTCVLMRGVRFAQAVYATEIIVFGNVVASADVSLFDETSGMWRNSTLIPLSRTQMTFNLQLAHIPLDGSVLTSRARLVMTTFSSTMTASVDAVLLAGSVTPPVPTPPPAPTPLVCPATVSLNPLSALNSDLMDALCVAPNVCQYICNVVSCAVDNVSVLDKCL